MLVDLTGRQHVVLRTSGAALQLTIEGADLTARPVAVTFLVHGSAAIRRACDQLRLLDRILSQDGTPTPPRVQWTPRTRNLRDALVKVLRVSRRTLDNYRSRKQGPPYRRHGGRIVYRLSDLLAWSERRGAGSWGGCWPRR